MEESRITLDLGPYRTFLRGEVYRFSASLGAYVLVITAIILLIIKSRTATPVPVAEEEVKVKDVNIDPVGTPAQTISSLY